MSIFSPKKSACSLSLGRSDRGSALIIILSFILIITALVSLFLSRSLYNRQTASSSFNQSKTDELARSALDVITGDLKQEIVNGSTPSTSGNTTIYVPNTAKYPTCMVPTLNGVPGAVGVTATSWATTWGPKQFALNTTLLRTSCTTTIASPGVDHAASSALTTAPSANGRSVSLQRWNQSYLIPLSSKTPTDTTPDANFTAPSWVYVTQNNGPEVLTNPTSDATSGPVTGRYGLRHLRRGGSPGCQCRGVSLPHRHLRLLPQPTRLQDAPGVRRQGGFFLCRSDGPFSRQFLLDLFTRASGHQQPRRLA